MSKAITDMVNDGIEQGIEIGIEKGIEKQKIASVDRMQKKLGLSLQEACDVEEISVDEYEKTKALL